MKSEADAAYIRLMKSEGAVRETVEFAEGGMQADLDDKGNVIGIEIFELLQKKNSFE
jgi:uncharacterized protein YuzE